MVKYNQVVKWSPRRRGEKMQTRSTDTMAPGVLEILRDGDSGEVTGDSFFNMIQELRLIKDTLTAEDLRMLAEYEGQLKDYLEGGI